MSTVENDGEEAGDRGEVYGAMRYQATRPLLRRMQAIDRALRAGRWPTDKSLAKELKVDPRTIRRDLEFMRDEQNAPIEFDRIRGGYYYAEPTYQLPLVQMTQGELLGLYLSERMLRQFRGTPFEPDLRQAIAKLTDMLPDNVTVRLDSIGDFLSVLPAVEAEYDPASFCALLRAVVGRRQLDMVYWTASRNETTRRFFDPYELSLVDDGWYAFGYCHKAREIRMFAVQRVRSVRETGETFDRPADFHAEDYMKGSFRAIRGDGQFEVILRFSPVAAGWIAEKKWHHSQVVKRQPDGSLILKLEVNDLRLVKRWAMYWGSDCEVLGPPELRDLVAGEAQEMVRRGEATGTKPPSFEVGSLEVQSNVKKQPARRRRG